MTYLLGFVIALAIGLTGVGAGTLTTPLLILAVGLPARIAVGTSLIFGAVVKIITSPVYMARRQVDWRTLGFMLAGGVPGVLIGVFLLRGFNAKVITGVIGATIVTVALFNLFRPTTANRHDHTKWLALVALPIGTEVGFSSAGAGALGALSLLSMTRLSAAAVVGTDLVFGLVVSLIGGGVNAALGNLDGMVLKELLVGGVPGAVFGAYLAGRVPSKPMRMGLSGAMALLGASLFYKGFF
ncbi:MAG TPA: sulfite exporter TauE/SafE family protein [Bryobacteraceae bacterium]|nr:sulfite exporter TauE/SafE family protein [Bryobacteraceae bacterium]